MRNLPHQITRPALAAVIVSLLLGFSGCATKTPAPKPEPLVFPPPPAKARFVFDRTLRYRDDVQKQTTLERIKRFATGAPHQVKGLVKPFDVAVNEGRIYVTDTVQRRVIVFDIPNGDYKEFGTEAPGALSKPIGIDVTPQGEVFVSDVSANRIMVYDKQGQFLRAIGINADLQRPSDVAVDPKRQRVYVVDTGGVDSQDHQIWVFDAGTGEHLDTIGTRGSKSGQFNLPLQATVGPDGTLYVVDTGNFRVQGFAPDGSTIVDFGSLGRYPGEFARPKGITTDPDGNIYVVDAAFGNFQIFTPDGKLLLFIGRRGATGKPATYMLPAGIDSDQKGRIYVVDQFFRKVDVYRPADLPAKAPW